MVLQDFINSVIKQLKKVKNRKVYDDPVKQGLEKGSFFVQVTNTEYKRKRGDKRLYTLSFALVYIPETKNYTEEFAEVQQQITDNFSYLDVGENKFHIFGIERKNNGQDDALILSFKIEAYLQIVDDSEKVSMEKLEVKNNGN